MNRVTTLAMRIYIAGLMIAGLSGAGANSEADELRPGVNVDRDSVGAASAPDLRTLISDYRRLSNNDVETLLGIRSDDEAGHFMREAKKTRTELTVLRAGVNDRLGAARRAGAKDEADDLIFIQSEVDGMIRCYNKLTGLQVIFAKQSNSGETITNWIQSDTSGEYRKELLRLCSY